MNDSLHANDLPEWARPVASERLVVLSASAGGLDALTTVLSALPADFPAAIAIIQHRSATQPELLPQLLAARTQLNVRNARDGELLRAGTAYICPPGTHMTAEHCVRLVDGPRLAYVRPSADLMLASAARTYGGRAVSVVLSGQGRDGAAGSAIVAEAGGTTLAQDPSSAAHGSMPAAAAPHAQYIVPLELVGETLLRLFPGANVTFARTRRTRVLLADDHQIMREGLRRLLEEEDDVQVVAEASCGRTAVRVAAALLPDVVVMDVAMPDLDGVEATRQIKVHNARTSIIALSAFSDARTSSEMLAAGAARYLSKDAAFNELANAIRAVAPRDAVSPRGG